MLLFRSNINSHIRSVSEGFQKCALQCTRHWSNVTSKETAVRSVGEAQLNLMGPGKTRSEAMVDEQVERDGFIMFGFCDWAHNYIIGLIVTGLGF